MDFITDQPVDAILIYTIANVIPDIGSYDERTAQRIMRVIRGTHKLVVRHEWYERVRTSDNVLMLIEDARFVEWFILPVATRPTWQSVSNSLDAGTGWLMGESCNGRVITGAHLDCMYHSLKSV